MSLKNSSRNNPSAPLQGAWLYNDGAGRTYDELETTPPSSEGWLPRDYTYDDAHPHAVASVAYTGGPDNYTYDANTTAHHCVALRGTGGNTLAPHCTERSVVQCRCDLPHRGRCDPSAGSGQAYKQNYNADRAAPRAKPNRRVRSAAVGTRPTATHHYAQGRWDLRGENGEWFEQVYNTDCETPPQGAAGEGKGEGLQACPTHSRYFPQRRLFVHVRRPRRTERYNFISS